MVEDDLELLVLVILLLECWNPRLTFILLALGGLRALTLLDKHSTY